MRALRRRIFSVAVVAWLFLFFAQWWADTLSSAQAQPPSVWVTAGQEIMGRSFNRDDGSDAFFALEMALIDKKGSTRTRAVDILTKDYGALMKSLVRFSAPADIAGTTFLSWENEASDETQYLYLPALKRARRIVSSQKALRFVNTDYTYEDMQRRHPQEDTHRLLRQETYLGRRCFVVESIPVSKDNSQYAKRIQWVDAESFVVLQIEFFDKKAAVSKRFSVEQLEKRDNIWTPLVTRMRDYNDTHTTVMTVMAVRYNQGLADGLFTLRALEQE